MDDKLNNTESMEIDESTNHKPPDTDEAGQNETSAARIAELESLLTQKGDELELASTRIAGLEQATAELNEKLTDNGNALSQAIASYRALAIKSNPDIIEELISGDSIEEIDASLERAQNLIIKVKKGLEEEVSAIRVPAGSPQRAPFDLSILSPREKIQYAIGGKK